MPVVQIGPESVIRRFVASLWASLTREFLDSVPAVGLYAEPKSYVLVTWISYMH